MANHNSSWPRRLWDNLKELSRFKTQASAIWRFNNSNHHNEFIIIGLGRFGTSLAMTLTAHNHDLLAIDADIKRAQQVSQFLPRVIQLDATNIDALREVGAESFDTGIVCIGADFEANVLATVSLRKLGVSRVITKVRTITQQEILQRVGADEVILPEHEAGVRLARRLAAIDFVDFMELNQETGVVEIVTPRRLIDQSLAEAAIRQRYGLAVAAIKRGDDIIVSPLADEIMREDDILVILGRTADCEKLQGAR